MQSRISSIPYAFLFTSIFFYVDRRDDFIVTEFVDSYGVVVYLI